MAVTSTPEGRRHPWLDVQITLQDPNGIIIARNTNTSDTFADQQGSLIIVRERDKALETGNTIRRAKCLSLSMLHASSDSISILLLPAPPLMIGFKCKACKTTAKALALSIVAVVTLTAFPQAVIAAVASFLGAGAAVATAFISSVVGDTVDTVAEKLCKMVGLC